MHENFKIRLNEENYEISVPEEVKELTPSIPSTHNVNEMRFQIARLYTALHIEVSKRYNTGGGGYKVIQLGGYKVRQVGGYNVKCWFCVRPYNHHPL